MIKTSNILDSFLLSYKPILYIVGPTAIGKSALAVTAARQLNCEIVSADAFQVYRGMSIGTAKPTIAQRSGIRHHLIDTLDPDMPYSLYDFLKEARLQIALAKKNNTPLVICGGNGLYCRALLYNYSLATPPPCAPSITASLTQTYDQGHQHTLHQELSRIDPDSAVKIHPNNKHHLIRALEIWHCTNKKPSTLKHQHPSANSDIFVLGLTAARSRVKECIDRRVDTMMDTGFVEEVRTLLSEGYSPLLPALKAIGYPELIAHLNGQCSLECAIINTKKKTAQFAKRQETWFKKIHEIHWHTAHL